MYYLIIYNAVSCLQGNRSLTVLSTPIFFPLDVKHSSYCRSHLCHSWLNLCHGVSLVFLIFFPPLLRDYCAAISSQHSCYVSDSFCDTTRSSCSTFTFNNKLQWLLLCSFRPQNEKEGITQWSIQTAYTAPYAKLQYPQRTVRSYNAAKK